MTSFKASSREVLPFALWAGLVMGAVEGAAALVLQRLGWPVRVSPQILWIAPIVGTVLLIVIGLGFALLRATAPRWIGARHWLTAVLWVVLFGWLQLADVMRPVAALILGLGLAVATTRPAGAVIWWQRLARRSFVAVAGIVVILAFAGLVWAPFAEHYAVAALPRVSASSLPNVLLITLDTLRADHVSTYGYDRATTPNFDKLAARGATFDHAFANASWTLPSHASLLTGRYPHEHGADWLRAMRIGFPTLPEVLAAHGYQTAAFAANTSYVAPEWGLGRGFTRFDVHGGTAGDAVVRTAYGRRLALNVLPRVGFFDIPGRKRAAAVNQEVLSWLDRRETTRPFFVLLNYLDVHDPYVTAEPYRSRFSSQPARGDVINFQFQPHAFRRKSALSREEIQAEIDAYDGCLSYLDAMLGSLMEALSTRGLSGQTLVIVTSDHGESFGSHDLFGHGNSLYFDTLHVPLTIAWADHVPAGVRIDAPVGLERVPSTIVDLIGLDDTRVLPGRSLASLWNQRPPDPLEPSGAMAEVSGVQDGPSGYPTTIGSLVSLITPEWHLIVSSAGRTELYAWRTDPAEAEDVSGAAENDSIVASLRRTLARTREWNRP